MRARQIKIIVNQLDILVYVLTVPFVVFYIFPYFILQLQSRYDFEIVENEFMSLIGIVVIDSGVVLALWCIAILFVYKKGSLHPFAEPKSFIVKGPYKKILHPMLLASHIILFGEILFLQSPFLFIWLFIWIRFAHLYAARFKEPHYIVAFGKEYYDYWKSTPRWLPRFFNHNFK